MLKGTVENNPYEGPRSCFEGVARNFSPIRGTNSITTIFRLNTIKNNAKVPAVDIVKLNIRRGIKTALLTPKMYDEFPRHLDGSPAQRVTNPFLRPQTLTSLVSMFVLIIFLRYLIKNWQTFLRTY